MFFKSQTNVLIYSLSVMLHSQKNDSCVDYKYSLFRIFMLKQKTKVVKDSTLPGGKYCAHR